MNRFDIHVYMIKTMTIMNDVSAMSLVIHARLDIKGFSQWERDKLRKGAACHCVRNVGVVRTG
jgi:hypothetical protein